MAIECKWSEERFEPSGLLAFRRQHPEGENVVVAHDVGRPHERNYSELKVRFVGMTGLLDHLGARKGDQPF